MFRLDHQSPRVPTSQHGGYVVCADSSTTFPASLPDGCQQLPSQISNIERRGILVLRDDDVIDTAPTPVPPTDSFELREQRF
jgi:hypothetical protein